MKARPSAPLTQQEVGRELTVHLSTQFQSRRTFISVPQDVWELSNSCLALCSALRNKDLLCSTLMSAMGFLWAQFGGSTAMPPTSLECLAASWLNQQILFPFPLISSSYQIWQAWIITHTSKGIEQSWNCFKQNLLSMALGCSQPSNQLPHFCVFSGAFLHYYDH